MKALGYALAAFACWLLQLAIRVLAITVRAVLLLALPLVSWFVRKPHGATQTLAAPSPDDVLLDEDATAAAPELLLAPRAPAPTSHSALAVADRIVSLRLDPPVGVIHLRLYQARRLVRRELIVLEPCLRSLLRGRRHALPDVAYDPVEGLEAIKNEAVDAAETLINTRGNAGRPRSTRRAGARAVPPPPTAPTPSANLQLQDPARAAAAGPLRESPAAATVSLQASTAYSYVGTLVKAGTATVRPEDRAPYDIFEATLQLDNGAELALRGAELQRELAACQCHLGQRIAITPMGKVPVALANGAAGHKNLYRVQLADAWPAGAAP